MIEDVKYSYTIKGQTSGWVRGPFSAIAAPIEAMRLANEKQETVEVERVTVTTTRTVIKVVDPDIS